MPLFVDSDVSTDVCAVRAGKREEGENSRIKHAQTVNLAERPAFFVAQDIHRLCHADKPTMRADGRVFTRTSNANPGELAREAPQPIKAFVHVPYGRSDVQRKAFREPLIDQVIVCGFVAVNDIRYHRKIKRWTAAQIAHPCVVASPISYGFTLSPCDESAVIYREALTNLERYG